MWVVKRLSRKMKDSGVEWIGEIPEAWKVVPLGTIFKERNEKVSDRNYEPLSVTKQGITKQLESAAKTDNHDNRKRVCKNDFVINSRSDRKQSCGISYFNGSVSVINIVLINKSLSFQYMKYLLDNYGFAEEFYKWGSGIVADLWSTRFDKMKKILIPIPLISEQQKIANFLDQKIFEIDNAIEKNKLSIEEYKKYKQSLITETVTKGLNPNVELKNSGIEWIGEIPKGWKIAQIKRYANICNGREVEIEIENKEYDDYDVINVYGSGGIFKRTNNFLYDGESVLFGRKGTIGKPLYVRGKFWTVDTMYFMKFGNELLAKYCYYYLTFYPWDNIMTKTALPSVVGTDVANTSFAFPSIYEQYQIVAFLDQKCSEIDTIILQKEQLISELESYKKSLIYECVTGKREVV